MAHSLPVKQREEFLVTRALTDVEARDVIKNGRVGRLGCIDNQEPYVVPINYLVDDDTIYSHSLPGRKIDAMRSHPEPVYK